MRFHSEVARRRVVSAVGWSLIIGLTTSLSGAFAASDLKKEYTGLTAYSEGAAVSGIVNPAGPDNNAFYRVGEDDEGDHMTVRAYVKDLQTGDNQPSYARVDWYDNGNFCVLTGISLGLSSLSSATNCQTDWHYTYEESSTRTGSGGIYVKYLKFQREGLMNSQRAVVRVCEDNDLFFPDACSGTRTGNIDWN